MAQKITAKLLENLLNVAVATLQEQGLLVNTEYRKSGCILLRNDGYGYRLSMILRDGETGEAGISDTMTTKEMHQFLQGIIALDNIKRKLDRAKESG